MFDISWSEFAIIAVIALIAIGPKELPGVLRMVGQWMGKARRMAAEFQSQFQEAMREAEMADLKKEVDDMASGIKNYDPLKDVRADVESLGKDFEKSLDRAAAPQPVEQQPAPAVAAAAALPDAGTMSPAPPPLREPAAGGVEPASSEPGR